MRFGYAPLMEAAANGLKGDVWPPPQKKGFPLRSTLVAKWETVGKKIVRIVS